MFLQLVITATCNSHTLSVVLFPSMQIVLWLDCYVAMAGHLVFRHAGDANEAFKQLPGAQETDSLGRAQKLLKLTSGALHCFANIKEICKA